MEFGLRGREVSAISVVRAERRIDLTWSTLDSPARWLKFPADVWDAYRRYGRGLDGLYRRRPGSSSQSRLSLAQRRIDVSGLEHEIGIQIGQDKYLLHGNLSEYLSELIQRVQRLSSEDDEYFWFALLAYTTGVIGTGGRDSAEDIEDRLARVNPKFGQRPEIAKISKLFRESGLDMFDTGLWSRRYSGVETMYFEE
jgi:hypothetical protein